MRAAVGDRLVARAARPIRWWPQRIARSGWPATSTRARARRTLLLLLLNAYAYAFGTMGTIAGIAALAAFVAAGVMLLLSGLGLWHSRRRPPTAKTGTFASTHDKNPATSPDGPLPVSATMTAQDANRSAEPTEPNAPGALLAIWRSSQPFPLRS